MRKARPQSRAALSAGNRGNSRWLGFAVGLLCGAFIAYEFWPAARSLLKKPEATTRSEHPTILTPVAPAPSVRADPNLAAVGTDSSVSAVPLRIMLAGTVPGRNVNEGSAMLGTDIRNAQTFMAGALLENGARLAEIYADHVVLERNGQRAALYLTRTDSSEAGERTTTDPVLTVGGASPKRVESFRYSSDPVSEYVRAVPYYENDAVVGFRVFPGTRSGPFAQWGLKSGDIIVSLNGSSLTDGDQATGILSELVQGASLTAKVLRGSDRLTLALNGADVVRLNEARTALPAAFGVGGQ